jgi:hypothetical protein
LALIEKVFKAQSEVENFSVETSAVGFEKVKRNLGVIKYSKFLRVLRLSGESKRRRRGRRNINQ